ncbi:regucalcin-like [Haemaphysalis longicornis]
MKPSSTPGLRVRVASKRRCQVGEGPHWDEKAQALLYVDCYAGCVSRLDPETHEDIDTIHFEGKIPFAIPLATQHHKIVIGHNHYVKVTDMKKKHEDLIAMVEAENAGTRLNDAKCDAAGRLWTGTMAIEKKPMEVTSEQGSMYSVEKKHIRKHVERITVPNGIAWTADNKKMFFVDSGPRKLYIYDFDLAKGDVSNQKVVANFNQPSFEELGYPDGITIDHTDKVWIACYDGGHVVKIDPTTGAVVQKIKLPTQHVTSLCFGGPRYEDLFVTSGFIGLTRDQLHSQPDAGAIFKISGIQGTKGLPPNCFAA